MIALVQIIRTLEDKLDMPPTFKTSRGRAIAIDAKTGKPKPKPSRMSASQHIAERKSKRVRPTKRVKGMINKP
jgi:hypothetical protein